MIRQAFLFILCFPLALNAQTIDASIMPLKKSKWHVGVSAAVDYNYRRLSSEDGNTVAEMIVSGRNTKEAAKWGYSGGVNIKYQVCEKLRLCGGLHYANHGYKTKPIDIADFDPLTGTSHVVASVYSVHSYHYLEVPLSVDWSYYKGSKLNLYLSAGITPGLLMKATGKSHMTHADGREESMGGTDETPYNRFSLSPTAALGAAYELNARTVISIAPTLRYGVLSIISAPIREFLWSGGVSVGYSRRL